MSDDPMVSQQKPLIQTDLQTGEKAGSHVISNPDKAGDGAQSTSSTVPAVVVSVIVLIIIAGVICFVFRRRTGRGGCFVRRRRQETVRRRRQERDSTYTQANNQQSPSKNTTDESSKEEQAPTKNIQKSVIDSPQHMYDSHIEKSVQAGAILIDNLTINYHTGNSTKDKDETTPKTDLNAEPDATRSYQRMNELKSVAFEGEQQTDPLLPIMHPLK